MGQQPHGAGVFIRFRHGKAPPMDNYGYYTMAGGGKSIETGYFLKNVVPRGD